MLVAGAGAGGCCVCWVGWVGGFCDLFCIWVVLLRLCIWCISVCFAVLVMVAVVLAYLVFC